MNEFAKRILKDFDLYNEDEKDEDPRKVTDKKVADAKLTEKFEKKEKVKAIALTTLVLISIYGTHHNYKTDTLPLISEEYHQTSYLYMSTKPTTTPPYELLYQDEQDSVMPFDVSFPIDKISNIYSSARDTADLTNGLIPDHTAGELYFVDLYGNNTETWMNITSDDIDIEKLEKIIGTGNYSVACTNDANLVGISGDELLKAGMITGFINAGDYFDIIYNTIENQKSL